jgi:hypothetical protein
MVERKVTAFTEIMASTPLYVLTRPGNRAIWPKSLPRQHSRATPEPFFCKRVLEEGVEGNCKGNERIRRVRRFFVVLVFFKAVLFLVHNML